MGEQVGRRGAAPRSPSMAQVAERAGVSHQTVSRVLNDASLVKEETRLRVLAAIEELGYRRNFAARLLATNRSRRIGMVTAHLALHGPSMIALAVQQAGQDQGYDVSLVGLPEFSFEALQSAVDRLSDQAVEAIIVAVAHKDAVEMTRSLQLGVPVVMVQGVVAGEPLSAGIDQEAGARLAVGHLLDLGHRHVAHVSGPPDWIEARHREAGWRAAHDERGLLPGPDTGRFGSRVPVSVRVAGGSTAPTGTVRLVSGDTLVATGALVDGRASFLVSTSDLGVGGRSLQVLYGGSATHATAATTVSLRVLAAASATSVRVVRAANRHSATARVHVSTDPDGQSPDRVRATLLRRGTVVKSRWLDLTDAGRARWHVGARRPGTYVVRVVTPGSATLDRSTDSARVRLR